MSHTSEHESWLEAVIAGDLDPLPPSVEEELRGCARCSKSWEESVRVQSSFSEAGRRRRAVSSQASRSTDAPGEARVEAFLRERLLEHAASRRAPRLRRPWLWALAASVLIALGVGLANRAGDDPPSSWRTLGGELVATAPGERATRSDLRFAWRSELPAGTRFRLIVEGRLRPGEPWIGLVDEKAVRGTEWAPPSRLESWPEFLRWRVLAYDAAGERLAGTEWSGVSLSH